MKRFDQHNRLISVNKGEPFSIVLPMIKYPWTWQIYFYRGLVQKWRKNVPFEFLEREDQDGRVRFDFIPTDFWCGRIKILKHVPFSVAVKEGLWYDVEVV